jgi:O-antigen/teichoic acid export membrane protein/peptidoglycan/xylan/chitin deacetylase (PgdA/CDA1 family)
MTSTKKTIGISFATQYTELVIQFSSVLILARILSPEDIGTFSVAAFLMMLLHVFRDFGVVQYIIQERELSNEKIQSAMGVAILLALAMAVLMLACSRLIAQFYGNPAIEPIMWVMAASFAISPFGSLLFAIYRREFRLKAIFWIKIISALSHVAVAVTLALFGFGALSLAWANFAGILAFGVVANLLRPHGLPRLPRFGHMRAILSYGGVSSLGNAANSIGTNMPDVVIGKVMNMAAVGYFSRANGLVQLFTRLITGALLPLVLPYFAKMRRDGQELSRPYLAAVEQLTALSWPFFTVLLLLAYPIVRALYGPQWDPSVPVMQLLCVAGAISSVSIFAAHVMIANDQLRESTWCQLISQPVRITAVLAASAFGLLWVAVATIAAELTTLLVASWFLRKTINISPRGLVGACFKSALITLCAALIPLLVNLYWHDSEHSWPQVAVGISGAAIGWIGSLLLTRHPLAAHLFAILPWGTATGTAPDLRLAGKSLAYRTGMLGLYHRLRNRHKLTVVMFHRVLPTTDPRHAGADPEWTMTTSSLRHCLKFFQRHYSVVSPEQVFSAQRGEVTLPVNSLLITFDDGWRDTAEYAQPILDELSLPALVFVAGEAIDSANPFWEEHVYSFLATHQDGLARLAATYGNVGAALPAGLPDRADEAGIRTVIRLMGQLDRETRHAVVTRLQPEHDTGPAMMSSEQLRGLVAAGHVIGGHGMVHCPLTGVPDLETELLRAQKTVAGVLDTPRIESMSMPHGAWNDQVLAQCRAVGYRFLFNSKPHLNLLVPGQPSLGPVGRIHVSERAIQDRRGRFRPSLLATWLFLRPASDLSSAYGGNHG